jgi:hypothetical protein
MLSIRKKAPEAPLDPRGPLGLNVLHASSEPLIEFVFVHGLGGGSKKTWTHCNDPDLYWPKEWLSKDPAFKFAYTALDMTQIGQIQSHPRVPFMTSASLY